MQEADGERGSEVSHDLNPYSDHGEFQPAVLAAASQSAPRPPAQEFDGDAWKNSFVLSHGDAESEEIDHDLSMNFDVNRENKHHERLRHTMNLKSRPAAPAKNSHLASMASPVMTFKVQTKQKLQFSDVKPRDFTVPMLRISEVEDPSPRQQSLYGRLEMNFKRNQQALINKYSSAVIVCSLFMLCEIVGGLFCHSNAIIVDGVLKLSDICTFLVSILFLENKSKVNYKQKSNSIDTQIVKGALFQLVVQLVAICFLIWRGVSMLSSRARIVINTDVMLVFACISLACAYFTMYVHGYFQNQSCCVYDSMNQAQGTSNRYLPGESSASTPFHNEPTRPRQYQTRPFQQSAPFPQAGRNYSTNAISQSAVYRKDFTSAVPVTDRISKKSSGRSTENLMKTTTGHLRSSASLNSKHYQQWLGHEIFEEGLNAEQYKDDIEQGLLYNEKEQTSSKVNLYDEVDIREYESQTQRDLYSQDIGCDADAETPRTTLPTNSNVLEQLQQITVVKNHMFVDMLQSLVLIVISLIIQNHPETAYLDPIFSFFMSFTAAVVNLPVITNCISILLIEPPVLDAIKSKIEKLNEVALVSDIYIIQRSGGDEVLNVQVLSKKSDSQQKIQIQQQVAKIARSSGMTIAQVQFQGN